MTQVEDDRTHEEKEAYTAGVAGTDKFLSGWGLAAGGTSVACWACKPADLGVVEEWVRSRSDMMRVRRIYDLGKWKPRAKHVHIYVAAECVPKLRKRMFRALIVLGPWPYKIRVVRNDASRQYHAFVEDRRNDTVLVSRRGFAKSKDAVSWARQKMYGLADMQCGTAQRQSTVR